MDHAVARSHYEVLDVKRSDSRTQIRRAYLRASLKAHPDHGGSHSDMLAVNAAWTALSQGRLCEVNVDDGDQQNFQSDESPSYGSQASNTDSDWTPEHDDQDPDSHYEYGDLDEEGGRYVVQLENDEEISLEDHAKTCTCDLEHAFVRQPQMSSTA